ncbi:Glycerol-3-phosphate ABC transporter, permease protein UgpE (TC 3.A.1.1.3) [Olavius sp. associated proteobacterium Delta 1]|nr:Glycerol-3-phosphate ABC transporter, permease protein UgpE (TC 3.A.1.1.3) [Olavius sp. associated proteobacterium Delta 1]
MMVENNPYRTILTHTILIMGIAVIIFPIYITLVASTHEKKDIATSVQPWLGDHLIENYTTVLKSGKKTVGGVPVGQMMVNSLIMSVGIVVGKIEISIISAFAIVYFRFPLRMFFSGLFF